MEDIASLGMRIDSSQAAQAKSELLGLATAGGQAEGATQKLEQATVKATKGFRDLEEAATRSTKAASQNRAAIQQAGYQINDFATQVSSGINPIVAFNQQIGQLGFAMQNMRGTLGAVGSFLAGPWAAVVLVGTTILGQFAQRFFETSDASEEASKGLAEFQKHQSDIKSFIDETTGALKEQNRTLIQNAVLTRQAAIEANKEGIAKQTARAFNLARSEASLTTSSNLFPGPSVATTMVDRDVQAAIRAAGKDVAKLDSNLQALGQRRPDLRGTIKDISDAAAQAVFLQRKNEDLAKEIKGLSGDTSAFAKANAELIERQVALAGATTPLEKAQRTLDLVREQGRKALEDKTITEDEYRKRLTAATAAVNAAEASEKALAKARAAANKERRDAEREARQATATASDIQRRGASGDQAMAQAAAEELQARRGVIHEVQDRARLEREINAAELRVKNEAIEKQIVDIQTDQNLAGAQNKAERDRLTAQLQTVQWLNAWNAMLKDQAVTEQERQAAAKEALARDQAARENDIGILEAQAGLAKSSYVRWQLEQQIANAQRDQLRAALRAVSIINGNTQAEVDIAAAKLAYLDQIQKLTAPKATDDLFQAFSSAQDALQNLAQAVKSHDWASAWNSLASAIQTLKQAFSSAGTIGGKIGAVAGVAQAAGNIIGGGVGAVLGGAAGGAMAGFTVGGPIGAAIGGIIGGIGGLLGNSAKKRQEELARQQAEAQRQEQIRQQARQLEIRDLQATNNWLGALNAQRNDEIDALAPENRELGRKIQAEEQAKQIADQARELNIQLLTTEGKTAEATAIQRKAYLDTLFPELRDLQARVWIAQDAAAADQKAKDIAQQRASIEEDYYNTINDSVTATAIARDQERASVDATLRPLLEAKFAAEDWAAAIQKVNEAVSNAVSQVDNQINAAQSASQAAHQSAQAYRDAATSLQEAARQVRGGVQSPAQNVASQRAFLDRTFGLALSGDTAALGQLGQLGTAYLDTFKGQATNGIDVQRETARVASMLDQAAKAAGIDAGVMDYQSTLLDIQVGLLKDVKAELSKPNPDLEVLKRQENLLVNIGQLLQDQTGNLVTINSTLTDQTGQIITGNAIVSAQTGQLVSVNLSGAQLIAAATHQSVDKLLGSTINVVDPATGQLVAVTIDQTGRLSSATMSSAQIIAAVTQTTGVGLAQTVLIGTYSIRDAVGSVYQVSLDQSGRITSVRDALGVQTGQLLAGNYYVTDPATGQLVGLTVDQTGRVTGGIGSLAAIQAAVAQAVYQQTGQVMTGNSILSAQTGQLQQQTGATQQGLSVQDAIRNLAGAQTAYSAQMLQALAGSGSSNAYFQAMLNGINSTVSVLADIRTVLGAPKGTPAPAVPQLPPPPVVSAYDQARAALFAGDRGAAQRYLNANPDIAYRYSHPTGNAGDVNPTSGQDVLDFALMHFRLAGQFEAFADHGRNLFAAGGAFTNGIVSRPTAFNMGVMGEGGRSEGILPLANIGGRLGVYAANDNTSAAEIRALRDEVKNLRIALEQIAINTGRGARTAEKTHDLLDELSNGATAIPTVAA